MALFRLKNPLKSNTLLALARWAAPFASGWRELAQTQPRCSAWAPQSYSPTEKLGLVAAL